MASWTAQRAASQTSETAPALEGSTSDRAMMNALAIFIRLSLLVALGGCGAHDRPRWMSKGCASWTDTRVRCVPAAGRRCGTRRLSVAMAEPTGFERHGPVACHGDDTFAKIDCCSEPRTNVRS